VVDGDAAFVHHFLKVPVADAAATTTWAPTATSSPTTSRRTSPP